ncbi:serine kinase [uncultured Brevundimonas sp.]|uniref:HPr kinase/phosphorylase n=1 Tax=uncultured Brevundimonas sp. TaxID=213418 RepID=UPI0030EB395E|tara:strand:- start:85263 stop:85691 length:429 start_codon:yes stop_codon:yes gene_type:complete
MSPPPTHATTVARWIPATGWIGVLISGPSGSGKSDLALRLIGRGWRLVADDYSHVFASAGALYATAPVQIAGRIEVRGLGIVSAPHLGLARLVLAVDCVDQPPERLPGPDRIPVAGLDLPRLKVIARHASAVEFITAATAEL